MRSDTLEKTYVLNLEKSPETYGMLQSTIMHESSISFFSGIRDSRKAGSLWGMMRSVEVRKSEQQSLLAKGLGLELLC